jgi:hypothetical protein
MRRRSTDCKKILVLFAGLPNCEIELRMREAGFARDSEPIACGIWEKIAKLACYLHRHIVGSDLRAQMRPWFCNVEHSCLCGRVGRANGRTGRSSLCSVARLPCSPRQSFSPCWRCGLPLPEPNAVTMSPEVIAQQPKAAIPIGMSNKWLCDIACHRAAAEGRTVPGALLPPLYLPSRLLRKRRSGVLWSRRRSFEKTCQLVNGSKNSHSLLVF